MSLLCWISVMQPITYLQQDIGQFLKVKLLNSIALATVLVTISTEILLAVVLTAY